MLVAMAKMTGCSASALLWSSINVVFCAAARPLSLKSFPSLFCVRVRFSTTVSSVSAAIVLPIEYGAVTDDYYLLGRQEVFF